MGRDPRSNLETILGTRQTPPVLPRELSDKESKEEREYLEAFEEERRLKAEIEAMEGEVASYENEVSLVLRLGIILEVVIGQ
jgi:hypothetical protein